MCMVVRSACIMYKGIMNHAVTAVISVSYGVVYERGLVNDREALRGQRSVMSSFHRQNNNIISTVITTGIQYTREEREGGRETKRQRDRDRKIETERQRQRDRDRDRKRERQRQRDRDKDRKTETERQRQRQKERETETERQRQRQKDRDRETETETERERDRERERRGGEIHQCSN